MRHSILPTLFMLAVFAQVIVGIPILDKDILRARAPQSSLYSISTFDNTGCTGKPIQSFVGSNGNDHSDARPPFKCVLFNQAYPQYCKVRITESYNNVQVIEGPLNPGHKVVLRGGATGLRIQCPPAQPTAITTDKAVQLGAAGGARPYGNSPPNFSRPLNKGAGSSWI